RGTAILTATYEGQSASETFTVEPGIAGAWSGSYVIEQCAAGAASTHDVVCGGTPGRPAGMLAAGTAVPITLDITQSGASLTAVVMLGDIRGTLTGTDRGQNFLALRGDLKNARDTLMTIVLWDTRVRRDAMDGAICFEVRVAGLPSNAALTGRIEGMNRVSR
ncbi:MAG TPA: hypothetical protein VEA16_23160, partial [Vicinamibacterales bacterium]|nr:hypothetical protein [Vicinamibacterales bacterium]